jgi:hypothetical protein
LLKLDLLLLARVSTEEAPGALLRLLDVIEHLLNFMEELLAALGLDAVDELKLPVMGARLLLQQTL